MLSSSRNDLSNPVSIVQYSSWVNVGSRPESRQKPCFRPNCARLDPRLLRTLRAPLERAAHRAPEAPARLAPPVRSPRRLWRQSDPRYYLPRVRLRNPFAMDRPRSDNPAHEIANSFVTA